MNLPCDRKDDIDEIKKDMRELKDLVNLKVIPKLITHSFIVSIAKSTTLIFATTIGGSLIAAFSWYLSKK